MVREVFQLGAADPDDRKTSFLEDLIRVAVPVDPSENDARPSSLSPLQQHDHALAVSDIFAPDMQLGYRGHMGKDEDAPALRGRAQCFGEPAHGFHRKTVAVFPVRVEGIRKDHAQLLIGQVSEIPGLFAPKVQLRGLCLGESCRIPFKVIPVVVPDADVKLFRDRAQVVQLPLNQRSGISRGQKTVDEIAQMHDSVRFYTSGHLGKALPCLRPDPVYCVVRIREQK